MGYDVASVARRNKTNETVAIQEKNEIEFDVSESEASYLVGYKDHEHLKDSLKGDYWAIFLLLVLYILQGIPLGLAGSIPLILQSYNVTYAQQAIFSLATWPFSLKLLWAPIVDSIYSKKFGRRKSWLIPTQYLIGLCLLLLSYNINKLMGQSSSEKIQGVNNNLPNLPLITLLFFLINFLCATQDIAVDGWALSIISQKNVVYASTCNTVGQTIGYTLGYIIFLALESPEVCNRFRSVPQAEGLVTFSGFLFFWAIVFIIVTTLVLLFKDETVTERDKHEMNVMETYFLLYRILKLKNVKIFMFILLTCKVGFAITDNGTSLKLAEAGVSKENLAFLGIPLIPLQLVLPWILSRYTKGPQPLNIFLKSYPFRLCCGFIFALLLYCTQFMYNPQEKTFPFFYYIIVIAVGAFHQTLVYCCYVSLMAFHAKISDPSIGGTYMTFLNTLTNFGGNWPSFVALWLLDCLTWKKCSINDSYCDNIKLTKDCLSVGGSCDTQIDGYYIETVLFTFLGAIWLFFMKSKINQIQSLPNSAWKCN